MAGSHKSGDSAPQNGYEEAKEIIRQAQQTGLLSPLMSVLDTIIDDPILKETLQGAPVSNQHAQKSN